MARLDSVSKEPHKLRGCKSPYNGINRHRRALTPEYQSSSLSMSLRHFSSQRNVQKIGSMCPFIVFRFTDLVRHDMSCSFLLKMSTVQKKGLMVSLLPSNRIKGVKPPLQERCCIFLLIFRFLTVLFPSSTLITASARLESVLMLLEEIQIEYSKVSGGGKGMPSHIHLETLRGAISGDHYASSCQLHYIYIVEASSSFRSFPQV